MIRSDKDVLIILPAYNEEGSIRQVLERLSEPDISGFSDVLVINDASGDSTGDIVRESSKGLVNHIFNMGYGSALQIGYKYAVRKNYSYVIQMDADGQHDASNVLKIYQKLREKDADGKYPDIVLGSRYMEGSSPFPVSGVKMFAVKLFRGIIRLLTGKKLHDPTTGLQGLSGDAFYYYSQFNHFDETYPDANMILQMLLLGYKVVEIPAVMYQRETGKSMHSGLKPVWYMIYLIYDLCAVVFYYKILKKR